MKHPIVHLTLTALICLFFSFPSFAQEQSLPELYRLADQLKNAGKFEQAAEIENEIANRHSRLLLKIIRTADVKLELQEFDSAAMYLDAALGFRSDVPLNYGNEKFLAALDSMSQVGLGISQRLAEQAPSGSTHHLVGAYYLLNRDNDKALSAYEEAIKLEPNNPSFHFNMGRILIGIGRFEESRDHNSEALRIDSTYGGAWANRGYCNLELGNYNEAIQDFKGSLRNSEDMQGESFTMNNIGYAYLKLGNLDLARKSVEASLRMNSMNSYAWRNLALVAKEEGEIDEACEALTEALDKGFTYSYGDECEKLQKELCK